MRTTLVRSSRLGDVLIPHKVPSRASVCLLKDTSSSLARTEKTSDELLAEGGVDDLPDATLNVAGPRHSSLQEGSSSSRMYSMAFKSPCISRHTYSAIVAHGVNLVPSCLRRMCAVHHGPWDTKKAAM